MNLTGWWNHAVELEWQERQIAQSLPGWAVDDVLLSMLKCLTGSLRSVQLLLDHLVEMSIAVVGETMCLYGGSQWCSVYGEEDGSKNWSLRNPSDQLVCFGNLPSPGHLERPTCGIQTCGFPVMPSDERADRRIWWFTVSKTANRYSKELINWNQLLQSARLRWLRVAQNGHSWNLTS